MLFSTEAVPFSFIPPMTDNNAVYEIYPIFVIFWPHCAARGILIPHQGLNPHPCTASVES